MIKRILTLAILGAAFISNTGCKNDGGFKKIQGVEYKIIKDVPGTNAKIGDIIEFNILAKVDTLVLGDSRKQQNGKPAVGRVDSVRGAGQFQAVFPYLSVGDSALVYISCDTLLKTIPADRLAMAQKSAPWLKKGNKITVTLSIVSIKSMEEYKKEMEVEQKKMMEEMKAKEAAQAPIDDKLIQDYLAKNNIKAQKTASGLYYTIVKEGKGEKAKAGQDVTMMYIGKTLEGKQFDANADEKFNLLKDKTAFTFLLGQGQVIKGWDEGVQLLNKGSRANLYIPSPLAYGAQSPSPDVPANSVLVFNVEVMDIKAHKHQAPDQQMPEQAPQQ
jgi:FKBP-type peptidyl-prolyl cis-trans isomerase